MVISASIQISQELVAVDFGFEVCTVEGEQSDFDSRRTIGDLRSKKES